MAKSVVPIQQGQDYQARFFWLKASSLFFDESSVCRVGYEVAGAKSFDDVSVFYDPPITDESGEPVYGDYFQVKFHVDHAGSITCEALSNPKFIGAKSVSLLMRLKSAQEMHAPDGFGNRFFLICPWAVDANDPLAGLISNQNGNIRLDKLFDGTGDGSKMGKIRAHWKSHLQIEDDEGLERILRPLRIVKEFGTLTSVMERLNLSLFRAGLRPLGDIQVVNEYDDLIKKLGAQGKTEFERDELQSICEREGLWVGTPRRSEGRRRIGIRSFMRYSEMMEDETDVMLCLAKHFDGRFVRETDLWNTTIAQELQTFVEENVRKSQQWELRLDTHSSLAFFAGYLLDPKSGVEITLVQKGAKGTQVWRSESPDGNFEGWKSSEERLCAGVDEVALALSVTHDISKDVRLFVQRSLPNVGRLILCNVLPSVGPNSVNNGLHAAFLANEIHTMLSEERTVRERRETLHIFSSGPNALTFYLGQQSRGIGKSVLYEYDFESNEPGAYRPGIGIPVSH